jgi:hypothetical protein
VVGADPLAAGLDRGVLGHVADGGNAAAGTAPGFEDGDVASSADEFQGAGEAGKAGADDDDLLLAGAPDRRRLAARDRRDDPAGREHGRRLEQRPSRHDHALRVEAEGEPGIERLCHAFSFGSGPV